MSAPSIDGVRFFALKPHHDLRGTMVEIYRESWDLGCRVVQTNAMVSEANVLRGVHVHVWHVDHITVVSGRTTLGLHDARPWSPTAGRSEQADLDFLHPTVVVIPPGVGHGFYFSERSLVIYGVSHYWSPDDEIACRWDAPELGLAWPASTPVLSERDARAPTYAVFRKKFLQAWADVYGSLPSEAAKLTV